MPKHARYQLNESLPYFFKRWILMRKDAVLRPLYTFDEVNTNAHVTQQRTSSITKQTESA